MPVIDALTQNGCRFVVVGSAAIQLLDGSGEPRDLDIVALDTAADRHRLIRALAAVGGWIQTTSGPRPVAASPALPSWSWRVNTAYAPVDVIFRFADGTGYAEHAAAAIDVATPSGHMIPAHRTRHAA